MVSDSFTSEFDVQRSMFSVSNFEMPATDTVPDELKAAVDALLGQVNRLAVTARFMERPVFMAQLCEGLERGLQRHLSPWLDRSGAGDYSFSSAQFVDQMAAAGVINRYGGDGMPRFLKAEIDAAIRDGRWVTDRDRKSEVGRLKAA